MFNKTQQFWRYQLEKMGEQVDSLASMAPVPFFRVNWEGVWISIKIHGSSTH